MKRRTFLRGSLGALATVSVGLPTLEAMLDVNGTALADGSALPRRFVLWFWGNGNDPLRWTPTAEGIDWQPPEMLEALTPLKDYVNLVTGTSLPTRFAQNAAEKLNPHVEGAVGLLTGGNPLLHESFDMSSGDWNYATAPNPSIDVLVANQLGATTRHKLLTTAVTTLHGVASGKPGTAVRYISHQGPYTPNIPLYQPAELFDSLFMGGLPSFEPQGPSARDLARASVLDAVLEDAHDLERKLGASDRQRLDHHLTSIRELETRLRATPSTPPIGGSCQLLPRPETVESYQARAHLFAEVIAMAFACDLSRVATVEFSSPASHVAYPDVHDGPLVFGGTAHSFHEYQHNAGRDEQVRKALKYFVSNYAHFVDVLRQTPEGDLNLLDQSCVIGTSEVSTGENHGFVDYPILVAGKAQGALRYPGVHVNKGIAVPTTQVIYTCLRAMGLPLTSWGDDQFYVDAPISEIVGPNFV